jgi:peroxiredoxin Q/BCP
MRVPTLVLACFSTIVCASATFAAELPAPLQVGDQAPDFKLKTLGNKTVTLYETLKDGPTVVVVLRGYPGYQCPVCSKQVASLIEATQEFVSRQATVLLVYPGPAKRLNSRAREFLKETKLPDNFLLVTDPNYHFTDSYALRWQAPNETAYPSTFVVDQQRKVIFSLVSKTHGGRAKTKSVVKSLE